MQPKFVKTVTAEKTGYIVKKSNDSKKWKAMYFALNPAKKLLYYYESDAVGLIVGLSMVVLPAAS
jgi:hypothetical protein